MAVPRPGGAGRAVPDRAAVVLDGALAAAGAFADADQGEADPGLPDDFDQAGAAPGGVPVEPVEEVLGPAGVVPGVPVGPVEVEQVDDAGLLPVMAGCPSPRRRPPATRCRRYVQVRAISVMPSPVSTSDSVMSSDPQSGQTWAWNRTRSSVTAAHPCRGCRRGSAGRGRQASRAWVVIQVSAQPLWQGTSLTGDRHSAGLPHSTQGASGPMAAVPPVQGYWACGHAAGSVGHAEALLCFSG